MMKPFMDKDFLLQTETAQELYHNHAAKMPIIDYHCHLSAQAKTPPTGRNLRNGQRPFLIPSATRSTTGPIWSSRPLSALRSV